MGQKKLDKLKNEEWDESEDKKREMEFLKVDRQAHYDIDGTSFNGDNIFVAGDRDDVHASRVRGEEDPQTQDRKLNLDHESFKKSRSKSKK